MGWTTMSLQDGFRFVFKFCPTIQMCPNLVLALYMYSTIPNTFYCVVNLLYQGKYTAMAVCWLLGNGCLFSWNSMLTIEDYYSYLFPVNFSTYPSFCVNFDMIWLLILGKLDCNLNEEHDFYYTGLPPLKSSYPRIPTICPHYRRDSAVPWSQYEH